MERRLVQIENIHIGSRHREPDKAKVREIAKSIADVGLMNPPAVVFRDGVVIDGVEEDNVPVLIYGRHRLLAMQELGRSVVECAVHDVDDLHAELMEIDENLARADLSPAQEASHILRRKQIWEKINEGGKTLPTSSTGQRRQFAAEVSEVTGSSKRDVNMKIARARELGPDITRIVGTSLDKGVEMDALIKLAPDARADLIERAATGEKVSARPAQERPVSTLEAMAIIEPPPADRKAMQRQKFWEMWASLDDDVRQDLHHQLFSMKIE